MISMNPFASHGSSLSSRAPVDKPDRTADRPASAGRDRPQGAADNNEPGEAERESKLRRSRSVSGSGKPVNRNPSGEDFAQLLVLLANAHPELHEKLLRLQDKDGTSGDPGLQAMEIPSGSVTDAVVESEADLISMQDRLQYDMRRQPAFTGAGDVAQALIRNTSTVAGQFPLDYSYRDRSSSVQQLLAMGDVKSAELQNALDALLLHAGTTEGARLAALSVISESGLSLANGNGSGHDNLAGISFDAGAHRAQTVSSSGIVAATATPSEANRALTDINAVLRNRVDRVISRMKEEYGHEVTVVETVRSQERQDWLYEQGRTRSGSVVTWTRDSAHTRGDAVDVMIDGSYSDAVGFSRLQQIAREEGLRTLGMRDPGHLELVHTGSAVADETEASHQSLTGSLRKPANNTASQAAVATVAGVAQIASVARVTSGAANPVSASASAANADNQYTAAVQTLTTSGVYHNTGDGQRDSRSEARSSSSQKRHATIAVSGSSAAATTVGSSVDGSVFGPEGHSANASGTKPASASQSASGSSLAQRISDIDSIRSTTGGSVGRITLNLESQDGAPEKITIDVRGNSVQTHIATDRDTASRLRMQTAQLQDALGRHGLDADSVRISRLQSDDPSRVTTLDRELLYGAAGTASARESARGGGSMHRDHSDSREWQHQETDRREQAPRTRDERQQSEQDRKYRNIFNWETE